MSPLHSSERFAAAFASADDLVMQERAQNQNLIPHLLRCKELQRIEPWRRFKLVGEAISEVSDARWLNVLSSGTCGAGILLAVAWPEIYKLAGLLIALPAAAAPLLVRTALVRRVIREKVKAITVFAGQNVG